MNEDRGQFITNDPFSESQIFREGMRLDNRDVCRLLNIADEENRKLKQFRQDVIDWIDAQIKFNFKKYVETEDPHYKNENIDLHNFKVFLGIEDE